MATRTLTPVSDAAIAALGTAGERGLTWRDLAAIMGRHHGSVSGVLSRLHRLGDVQRLAPEHDRNGLSVYVLVGNVGDRRTLAYKGSARRPQNLDDRMTLGLARHYSHVGSPTGEKTAIANVPVGILERLIALAAK